MTEPARGAGHSYAPWATPAAATAAVAVAAAAHRPDCKLHKINDSHQIFFSLAPFAGCRCVAACRTNVNQRICKCKVNSLQEEGKTFRSTFGQKAAPHVNGKGGQVSQEIAEQLLQLNHLLNGINKAVAPLPLPPPHSSPFSVTHSLNLLTEFAGLSH